jgi:predicted amidohydrolase
MGDKAANLRTVFDAVEGAARERCDVVVFPECSGVGWCSPDCRSAAEPIPGPLTDALGRRARRHGMAVVIGMEEREGDRIFNTAAFIGRRGDILARHRKINELDIGLRFYSRGGSLGVVDFEGRRVGLDICADSWIPGIVDTLHLMGARLVFSPCAWAVRPGGEARNIAKIRRWYATRTKGKDLTIVSANGTGRVTQGPWRGRLLQGESLVTGPGGTLLLRGPRNRAALLTADF